MFKHTSFTVTHQIERAFYEFQNWTALVHYIGYHRRSFTYGELRVLSHKMAVYLESLGLIKGDKIAIWAQNSPEWVVLMLGASLMGLILVPIDTMAPESFAKNIYEKSKSKGLFTDKDVSGWGIISEKITSIFERLPQSQIPKSSYIVGGSDTLQIVYTSGTTSDPKGVVLSHQNLLANANSLRDRFVYPDGSCFLSILPLSHLLEQIIGCYGPLICGCKIVYVSNRPLPHMLRISLIEKASHMAAVPAILELLRKRIENKLLKSPLWKQYLFNFLRDVPYIGPHLLKPFRGPLKMIVSGGAALEPSTQVFFQKLGIDVLCGYGMTEASPVITCQSPHKQTPGQVGKALPRQFLRINNDGEILIFGDNITSGYFENKAATSSCFTSDGWFKTGDIGKIDESGNLTLLGRIKEMILTENGMNVFPQDIEVILERLCPDSKAVALEDPLSKGRLIAALKTKNDVDLDLLLKQANENLSGAQKLSHIYLWNGDFPRTHTLKIQRAKVSEFFARKDTARTNPLSKEIPKAISIVFQLCGQEPAEKWTDLRLQASLGFDSIKIVQLWMRLQNDLGIELSSQVFEGDPPLGEWLKKIEQAPKGKKIYLGNNAHGWFLSAIRLFVQPLIRFILSHFFPVKIQTNFPKDLLKSKKPIMIIANHTSHLDMLTLIQALPYPLRQRATVAAARDYFFEKNYGWLGRLINCFVGCIGFSRTGDHETNMELLEKNWNLSHCLILMPEGTRSRTGELLPFKRGAAWIALQFHALILPVRLEGCFGLWPSSSSLPKKSGEISIEYRAVIDSEDFNDADALTRAMTQALSHSDKENLH